MVLSAASSAVGFPHGQNKSTIAHALSLALSLSLREAFPNQLLSHPSFLLNSVLIVVITGSVK